MRVLARGGVGIMLAGVDAHPNNKELLINTFSVVTQLAQDKDLRAQIAQDLTVDRLAEAIEMQVEDPLIVVKVMMLLGCLCEENLERQTAAADSGALALVVAAMRRHKGNADIQKWGCWCLFQLSYGASKVKGEVGKTGGIEAIVGAMRLGVDNLTIAQQGMAALGSLTVSTGGEVNAEDTHEVKEILCANIVSLQGEGLEVISKTMDAHPKHNEVVSLGKMLIARAQAIHMDPRLAAAQTVRMS